MDVFRASTVYDPPAGCRGVIPLREGDFFEVLESEEFRYHKDWWGVRRTTDNVVGYVPARYIKFEETRPEDVLPDDYQEQREMYVRQLQEMERMNLPDLYKMPPLTTKSYDDWRELDPDDPAAGVEPDYSDSDEDDDVTKPDGVTRSDGGGGGAPPSNSRDSPSLSQDDWAKIVASADMDVGDAPASPEPDLPEPDYQDDEDEGRDEEDGTDAHKKYKYKVILPAPDSGKYLGGDGKGGGAIQPKKLINPVLQSKEHQKLHREIMLNKKMGVDVLHQKSELKQKYDDIKKNQAKRLKEQESKAAKNPFELMLEERAEKLRLYEESQQSPTGSDKSPTFPALKSPTTPRSPSTPRSPATSPKSPTSPKTAPKPSAKPPKTDQNQNEQNEFLRVHSKIKKNPQSS